MATHCTRNLLDVVDRVWLALEMKTSLARQLRHTTAAMPQSSIVPPETSSQNISPS